MHRLPKMIVQKKKKKPTLFSIKKITPKYDALRFFDRTQRRFVYIVITVFRAHGRCRREILPVSCSDKKKGKKDDFPFCWRGSQPVLLHSWLVPVVGGTCTEWAWICVLHHPGEANCWQVERSGWFEPKHHEGRTRLWGGGKKVWKMSYFARHSHPGLPLCYKPFLICEAFGDTSCVSTHIKKKTCLPSAKRRDSVPAYMPYSKRHLAHEEEDFSVLSSKKMCRGSKRFVICLLIPFIKASITGMHTDFYLIPSHRCA